MVLPITARQIERQRLDLDVVTFQEFAEAGLREQDDNWGEDQRLRYIEACMEKHPPAGALPLYWSTKSAELTKIQSVILEAILDDIAGTRIPLGPARVRELITYFGLKVQVEQSVDYAAQVAASTR
jgi:hypothetical protein